MTDIDFDGKVVLVTGAGRGLGRSYAAEFARRGAAVVVNDLRNAELVVEEIAAAGGRAIANAHSVATAAGGAAIIEQTCSAFGGLDVVVNNAGVIDDAAFDALSLEQWSRVVRTHLDGAFHVSQPAFRVMQDRGGGTFVFVSSNAGLFGNPWQGNYAAAKAGIVGLMATIALEGERFGIRANALCPLAHTEAGDDLHMPEDAVRELGAIMAPLMGRIGPEFVAPMVAYLASDSCRDSGSIFCAHAGRYAKVFLGATPGWCSDGGMPPSAEEIARHAAEIAAEDGYATPTSMVDDYRITSESLVARGV